MNWSNVEGENLGTGFVCNWKYVVSNVETWEIVEYQRALRFIQSASATFPILPFDYAIQD